MRRDANMANENITPQDLANAINDPRVKNSKPDELIPNLLYMFGISDMPAIDEDECNTIRRSYFQAYKLVKTAWTLTPNQMGAVQTMPFRLREIPEGTKLVVDVFVDKSDYEVEVFDEFITDIAAKGRTIIFTASMVPPVDITIGLKCVDVDTEETIYIDDDLLYPMDNLNAFN